jgi:tetratricopeptide (TPR) repeat protein
LLVVGWGVAAWVGRAQRARALAWVLVGTGALVVLIALVQWHLDAASIYGSSGIPATVREPFFGPFVNANHGGALCAALVPVAIGIAAHGPVRPRIAGLVFVLFLSTGVALAGSRGAVVSLGIGSAAVLLAGGGRLTRALVLVALAAVLAWIMMLGPAQVLRSLGDLVAPQLGEMVDAGYVDLTTGRAVLLADVSVLARSVWPLGVGPGGFDEAYQIVKSSPAFITSAHAHNDLLQAAVEHGLPATSALVVAACLWLLVVVQGIRRSGSRPDRQWLMAGCVGTVAALGTTAMVDFPMRLGSHSLLLALTAGAALGLSRKRGRGRRASVLWRRSLGLLSVLAVAALLVATAVGLGSSPGEADDAAALRLRPTDRAAAQRHAHALVSAGEVERGAAVLGAATALYSTMPWLLRDQARLHQRRGDLVASQQMWRRMLALDLPGRTDPMPYVREAMLSGDNPDLMATAQLVLPERPDRRRQGARVFVHLGLVDEAETLFKDALARDPTGVGPYASALLRWGRPTEVIDMLKSGRDGCGTRRLRAQARLDLGEHSAAILAFQQAIAKCGRKDWSLQAGLGQARLLDGDARGEELVARLLLERPGAHSLRRTLATFLIARGRPGDAAPHLRQLVQAGVATPREIAVLPRASKGLPVRLYDLTGRTQSRTTDSP